MSISLDLNHLSLTCKRKREDGEEPGCKRARTQSPWGSEPRDIIEKISSFLHMRDVLHVHAVCKAWRDIYPIDGGFDFSGLKITGAILTQIKKALEDTPPPQARITSLDFSHCPLIKDADLKALKGFPFLTDLNLSHCDVSKWGMKSLKDLPLKVLNLSRCQKINDQALSHLASHQLESFNLSGNIWVTDRGLVHVKNMKDLHTLNLNDCDVGSDGLSELTALPLRHLTLSGWNNINVVGLKVLKNLPLKQLEIVKNSTDDISEEMLAEAAGLPLQSLDLAYCSGLSEVGMEHVMHMPLETLSLYECDFDVDIPGLLERIPTLRRLNATRFAIDVVGVKRVKGSMLEELDLSYAEVFDEELECLKALRLYSLNLKGCPISGKGLRHLAQQPLTDLSLEDCPITEMALRHLKKLPLRKLNLSGCKHLTPASAAHLQGLSLTTLSLREWRNPEAILAFIKAFPLTSLDLSDCVVNNAIIEQLSQMELQALYLDGCEITDTQLQRLQIPTLKSLTVSDLTGLDITDEGMTHLKTLPLEVLHISNCNGITNAGVLALSTHRLSVLDLGGCDSLSSACVNSLKKMPLKYLVVKANLWGKAKRELHPNLEIRLAL